MDDVKTGPVTYGQLSVLRSLNVHGPAGRSVANLISIWEIPFGVTTAQAMDAWMRLVEAHESLRTSFSKEGGTPLQHVHPFQPSPIPTVELSEDTFAAARLLAVEHASEPIPTDTARPWRALVATYQGDPLYLVTVVHHIVADNSALTLLEEQFGRLLQGASITEQPQPLELAREQREDPRSASRTVLHWTKEWERLVPEDRDPNDGSERRRASLYSVEGLEAARSLSERFTVSVQSILLSVGALAISRYEGRERITYALMSANRLDQRWEKVVSSLNQYAPVTLTVDTDQQAKDFLLSTYAQCLTAYLNGAYDVDALGESLRRRGDTDGEPTGFAKHFNFLGKVDFEPGPGSDLVNGIMWKSSTQRTGPNLHLAMATGRGVLIGVGASWDYLPGDLPAEIAVSIEAGLIDIAKNPEASLGEVSLAPIRNV